MKRLYEARAYGPRVGCWWDETAPAQPWPELVRDACADVAVIGGGFTGLWAAREAAAAGLDVVLLECGDPGFGASGRNGGFCCLGGALASRNVIRRDVGAVGLARWRAAEVSAVSFVSTFLESRGIEADRHSRGETCLAHRPSAFEGLRAMADHLHEDYGVAPEYVPPEDLAAHGLAGPFHGAMTIPIGFGLNPRKYHEGLSREVLGTGARLHARSPALRVARVSDHWQIDAPRAQVRARRLIVATNGYASEDIPDWMRARYLPVQSSILVTRPLTDDELARQGWTSDQMAYDSRSLLHYFRKLPDGRFLFGMRGGLSATRRSDAAIFRLLESDFRRMFPAWADVDVTHRWQGLVCLNARLHPFCGPVPECPGLYAAFGYHGNGVAMGSYCGHLIGRIASGQDPGEAWPDLVRRVPRRFPLGRFRRALLRPAYLLARLTDR